ncbi:MAG TPA: RidA family protein [Caldimonas sp.]|nr:RidA family protein [Caldimonas sp.]
MTLAIHNPASSAPPLGAYSNGISAPAGGRWLYIAGQVGVEPDGRVADGFAPQAEAAWRNLVAVLADAGMSASDLVKVTHYLLSPDDLAAYNAVRMRWLGAARPASTLVVVASLAKPEWRVEVEAIAWHA